MIKCKNSNEKRGKFMKRIKIFLASSIEELRLDRLEIGDFFDRLNGIYHDRGIDLRLIKCENYDNAIAVNGKQSEYDDEIRDSELVFFLFFKKVGEVTRHEFEVAVESFKEKDKPRIVTYFKYINSLDEVTDDVKAFMGMLANEMNHYYNSYKDIDTLKLGMLMQIQLFTPAVGDIKIEEEKITLNGEEFVSTKAIPAFSGNKNLQQLKEELKDVNESFLPLQKKFIENPGDKNAYSEFLAVANKKAELENSLKEAEENTLRLLKSMVKNQSEGGLSFRQSEGYRLLEMGDYDGALEVLSLDDIYSDIEKNEAVMEYSKEALQQNVNELLSRIEALYAKGVTPEIIDEIYGIYKKACELSEKNNLEKDVLHDFICFLHDQKKYDEAIELSKRLELYYELEKPEEYKSANLYNLIGMLYLSTNEFEASETYFLKAQKIQEEEALKNPDEIERDLSITYNNLGGLYIEFKKFDDAERCYLKALKIREKFSEKNTDEYESDLALSYNNIGLLYTYMQKYDDAEQYFLKTIELQEKLAEKDPDTFESALATSYNNAGGLYHSIKKYDFAKTYFSKAVRVQEKLVLKNPNVYENVRAITYYNLGGLYNAQKQYEEAEEFYLKAITLLEKLAKSNPDAFYKYLAPAYNNLGYLYEYTNKDDEAEKYLLKAVEIRKKLTEKNREAFESGLATTYNNLAYLYEKVKKFEKAKTYYLITIDFYEKFFTIRFDEYVNQLLDAYYALGNIYFKTKNNTEARGFFIKSMNILKKMFEKNPATEGIRLSNTYISIAVSYIAENKRDEAKVFLDKARNICERFKYKSRDYAELLESVNGLYRNYGI